MIYTVESDKSCFEVAVDLEEVVLRLGLSLQQVHDHGEMLRRRGLECDEELRIFDIASPRLSASLLACDMRLGLALPWRIAVFTEDGATRLGLLRPSILLAALSARPEVARLAGEFEEKLRQVIDEAR
ncbi:MAG: DUF302 domain-containing protein [Azonexus sp.]|jgi:uncharacterized protein (DUF302 family)|uniref:DUF302 domain-containing protein n=1 Tax=Azonexus sp. TaxID=1872668 RepID=UPI00281E753C|nr:DUF302 domain-containing protein [Azonexus sp.]MDR0777012.1 DUF302 domain-containing protein [Azonexus sp.]